MKFTNSKNKNKFIYRIIISFFVIFFGFLLVKKFFEVKSKLDYIKLIDEQILIEKRKNQEIMEIISSEESESSSKKENSNDDSIRIFENVIR